jgi:hypothetical protein
MRINQVSCAIQLTHGSLRVLWKLIVSELLKKFTGFYRPRWFNAVFTRSLHWSLSWARWIQPINLYIQGDSLGRAHRLIIMKDPIIYRWKHNISRTHHGRCGDNWVREYVEISSLRLEMRLHTTFCVLECCSQHDRGGVTDWRKWHEPGRQAPSQYCREYSVCQVSFSLVNDCVVYNYEFGASSERIILYINCNALLATSLVHTGHGKW